VTHPKPAFWPLFMTAPTLVHKGIPTLKRHMVHGFKLTEEKESITFGKPQREQRYDLLIPR
jgi:hypothetical protein